MTLLACPFLTIIDVVIVIIIIDGNDIISNVIIISSSNFGEANIENSEKG